MSRPDEINPYQALAHMEVVMRHLRTKIENDKEPSTEDFESFSMMSEAYAIVFDCLVSDGHDHNNEDDEDYCN